MLTAAVHSPEPARVGGGALAVLIERHGTITSGRWPRSDGHPAFSKGLDGEPAQVCGHSRIAGEGQVLAEQHDKRNLRQPRGSLPRIDAMAGNVIWAMRLPRRWNPFV